MTFTNNQPAVTADERRAALEEIGAWAEANPGELFPPEWKMLLKYEAALVLHGYPLVEPTSDPVALALRDEMLAKIQKLHLNDQRILERIRRGDEPETSVLAEEFYRLPVIHVANSCGRLETRGLIERNAANDGWVAIPIP